MQYLRYAVPNGKVSLHAMKAYGEVEAYLLLSRSWLVFSFMSREKEPILRLVGSQRWSQLFGEYINLLRCRDPSTIPRKSSQEPSHYTHYPTLFMLAFPCLFKD
jgi:hypothetical protein